MNIRILGLCHVLVGGAAVVLSVIVAGGIPLGGGINTWPFTIGLGYVILGTAALWRERTWDVQSGMFVTAMALGTSWGVRTLTELLDSDFLYLTSNLADSTVSVFLIAPVFFALPFGIARAEGARRASWFLAAVSIGMFGVGYAFWGEGLRHVGDPLWAGFLAVVIVVIGLPTLPPIYFGRYLSGET